jgi:hypothetical protein
MQIRQNKNIFLLFEYDFEAQMTYINILLDNIVIFKKWISQFFSYIIKKIGVREEMFFTAEVGETILY